MLRCGRGLRLDPKPPEPARILGVDRRQNFKRHAPSQRDLNRLVDVAHTAPTELADNSEVGKLIQLGERAGNQPTLGRLAIRGELSHEIERRQQLAELLGLRGMPDGKVVPVDGFAAANPQRKLCRPL